MPIRDATLKDAPAVLDLVQRFFAYEEMTLDELKRRMQDLNIGILVFEEKRKILGFADVETYRPSHGECRLNGIAVVPEKRERGIGKKLMEAAIAWCEERGMTRMFLLVEKGNTTAQHVYKEFGFAFKENVPSINGKPTQKWFKKLHPGKPSYVH